MKQTKKMFCIRMEQELIEKLEKQAYKKDRTLSSLIRVILKNYIQNEEI